MSVPPIVSYRSQRPQPPAFAGTPALPSKIAAPTGDTVHFRGNASDEPPLPKKNYPDLPHYIKPTRKLVRNGSIVSGLGITAATIVFPPAGVLFVPWLLATYQGYKDMTQKEHAILRTHPLLGRARFLLESIGPETRQYWINKDTDEVPLSREQAAIVYARAKGQNDKKAWGTLHDLNAVGAEWLAHSGRAKDIKEVPLPRVTIGNEQCKQKYEASVFNTSGMSYGSLSAQAVMALAKGAFLDRFYVNTGEGGISPFHLGFDVDINDPNFDFERILKIAETPMSPEEEEAARRNGKPGIIDKGVSSMLPLSIEEQIDALNAGKDRFIRERIAELLNELPPQQRMALGMNEQNAQQAVYDAIKQAEQGEEAQPLPKEQAEILYPIAAKVLAESYLSTPKEQAIKNEELLARGVSRMLGTNPQKLQKGLRGKIIKGLANKLRMSTMQFTRFPSGDLVWNIGTGYFGCRNPDGTFNERMFARKARLPQVKMIELKLSQGAKPGGGGVLPADKLTPGIAKLRGVPLGKDCISPARHSAFSTPREMMYFIQKLRDLSGGKPVGFKLAIGQPYEFLAICKAMRETGIVPDFITVDGAEGGTGAAPAALSDHAGMPINDALVLVHNALIGVGLRNKVKVIAAGKVVDEYDIISKLARGADLCNSARAMMLSIGCIMARICHTNRCPVGVATQDPDLTVGLDPDDKGLRNASYHRETIKGLKQMLGAAGLMRTDQVTADNVFIRTEPNKAIRLSKAYEFLKPGDLLKGRVTGDLAEEWEAANPDSYDPHPNSALAKRMAASVAARKDDYDPDADNG